MELGKVDEKSTTSFSSTRSATNTNNNHFYIQHLLSALFILESIPCGLYMHRFDVCINYLEVCQVHIKCLQVFLFFCFFLSFFRAAPTAHGGSQARGQIAVVATSLRHSHSNAGSKLHLQPTPQHRATPDSQPTEQGQGSNPQPHGYQLGSLITEPRWEFPISINYYYYIQ